MSKPHPRMKPPATRTDPGQTELQADSRGKKAIIRAEVEDLERELRAMRRKERRHFAWALAGASPAALILSTGLLLHGNYGLVVPVVLLGAFSQLFLGVKAAGETAGLKRTLENLRKCRHTRPIETLFGEI